ncbi:MAG: FAD-binding oxidoreductase [Mariprofundus sp.]|nr:FAD-binding oxidoreductase [Mariprofundus sp.]
MHNSSAYHMRVKENIHMIDPACQETVMQLTLTSKDGSPVPAFTAGQYVRLSIPSLKDPAPGYFAIASGPDSRSSYEFYIKEAGPLSSYLCAMEPSTQLEVEGPMGKGFNLDNHKGMDIYLIGVGTGIAPLRSLWKHIICHRSDYGKVIIYAGFRSALHQMLTDELMELSNYDIEVSITLETGHDSWDGPIGYVQHALQADAPDSAHAVACLAGMSAMVDACTETLQQLGFDENNILLNY